MRRHLAPSLAAVALVGGLACNQAQRRADQAYQTALDAYHATQAALPAAAQSALLAPPPRLDGKPKDQIMMLGGYLAELGFTLQTALQECPATKLERSIKAKETALAQEPLHPDPFHLAKAIYDQMRVDLASMKAKLPEAEAQAQKLRAADAQITAATLRINALAEGK